MPHVDKIYGKNTHFNRSNYSIHKNLKKEVFHEYLLLNKY
jgi:hypothetical protein